MTASAASPSSSPRLPSPPPIAEDQLGPMSPLPATEEQQKLSSALDHGAARRIRPGTKADDMAEGPPLVDLSEIDSAFQLTEHLKALHNFLTHPIGSNKTLAVDREMAHKLAHPPENTDSTLWLYELCRFLTQKVNSIIIALFSDSPACSSITCPEMRASEWQYLCAVHDPPKSCCAIDYCCHTLDWAANTLTSPKTFPSRLALGADGPTQHGQMRHLTNIFRRVYRIFAHAWFQHREMFWKVETRTGLYVFFKTVCDVYGLIPEDNYTIPSEAEGVEQATEVIPAPILLRRDPESSAEEALDHNLSTAGTTKRHRHSPSVGATAVSTVVEEAEEEEEPLTRLNTETLAPPTETVLGIREPAEEDSAEAETSEKAEAAEESATPTEATKEDDDAATEEGEKQGESDEEAADSEKESDDESSEADDADDAAEPGDQAQATSTSTAAEQRPATAEKAEKDSDEAADADKGDVKAQGDKAGSAEQE